MTEQQRSISAHGGGAKVENCGNTNSHYTHRVDVTINIDMRGTSRERFTERLEQVRELADALGFNFQRRDVQWAPDSRLVELTATRDECRASKHSPA
jgi:hypothetical protein